MSLLHQDTFSGHYLITLYDAIVGVMWRRLPTQMDGVILFVADCNGHSLWRGTGHCSKKVRLNVTALCY